MDGHTHTHTHMSAATHIHTRIHMHGVPLCPEGSKREICRRLTFQTCKGGWCLTWQTVCVLACSQSITRERERWEKILNNKPESIQSKLRLKKVITVTKEGKSSLLVKQISASLCGFVWHSWHKITLINWVQMNRLSRTIRESGLIGKLLVFNFSDNKGSLQPMKVQI